MYVYLWAITRGRYYFQGILVVMPVETIQLLKRMAQLYRVCLLPLAAWELGVGVWSTYHLRSANLVSDTKHHRRIHNTNTNTNTAPHSAYIFVIGPSVSKAKLSILSISRHRFLHGVSDHKLDCDFSR